MALVPGEWPVLVVAGAVVILVPAYRMWLCYAPVRALRRWTDANGYQLLEMHRRLLDMMGGTTFGGRIAFSLKVRCTDGVVRTGSAYVGSRFNPFTARVTVEWDDHGGQVP